MFLMHDLSSFRVMLARDWSEQADKEHALGELDDDDLWGSHAVKQHYRQRLTERLHRVEE